jgi:hypothetical protein
MFFANAGLWLRRSVFVGLFCSGLILRVQLAIVPASRPPWRLPISCTAQHDQRAPCAQTWMINPPRSGPLLTMHLLGSISARQRGGAPCPSTPVITHVCRRTVPRHMLVLHLLPMLLSLYVPCRSTGAQLIAFPGHRPEHQKAHPQSEKPAKDHLSCSDLSCLPFMSSRLPFLMLSECHVRHTSVQRVSPDPRPPKCVPSRRWLPRSVSFLFVC